MTNQFLKSLENSFEFKLADLRKIIEKFHADMGAGLAGRKSSLKMLPAFVDRAKGNERGKFMALDLGGTNFRIIEVNLNGKGRAKVSKTKKFVIPNAVMRGTGVQLFNFIAQSIQEFIVSTRLGTEEFRNLGFTFSFPMKQVDIAKGILIQWTKGFTASGVVGKNVVGMLEQSLRAYGIRNITISALANDTVGTMMTRAYEHKDCSMGIIFGTGTNACYREKMENIKKLRGGGKKRDHMIINIEWGNFDKLPLNKYDLKLDKTSNNPKCQIMEKMISGMYLGELARFVISDMIRKKYLFAGSKVKFSKGIFNTGDMSLVESDKVSSLPKIREYLKGIGVFNTTLEERRALKRVCEIISTRAAAISAAGISAVVTWMDPALDKNHVIAIDGTVYEKYPGFKGRILSVLKELHGQSSERIKLVSAKGGSGIGAAIIAAVATV